MKGGKVICVMYQSVRKGVVRCMDTARSPINVSVNWAGLEMLVIHVFLTLAVGMGCVRNHGNVTVKMDGLVHIVMKLLSTSLEIRRNLWTPLPPPPHKE